MIHGSHENPLSHFKGFLATAMEQKTLDTIERIDKYERSLVEVAAGERKAPFRVSKKDDPLNAYIKGMRQYPDLPLFMGIEIEMEAIAGNPDNGLDEILNSSPEFVIGKSDGSLRNGVEVVSVPATMNIHKERWPALLAKFRDKYRSFNPNNTGSSRCGMHIHLDRRAITMLHLGKMLTFINDPANEPFLSKVASRAINATTYCTQKTYRKVTDFLTMPRDKYSALNIAKPATVELRIFRGTLNDFSFLKNIEFAHAYHKYCGLFSQRDMTWQKFTHWATSQDARGDYYHLVTWLANNFEGIQMSIRGRSGKETKVPIVNPAALALKERHKKT